MATQQPRVRLDEPTNGKRRRRTKNQVQLLEAQICEALAGDHPQSLRHVYYVMTNPRLAEFVAKTEKGYVQIKDWLKKLRRAGTVPYYWVSDSTRTGYLCEHLSRQRGLPAIHGQPLPRQSLG